MLQKALNVNSSLAEANANLGMLSLLNGDTQTAEALIAKASTANGIGEVMGNLHLAQGKYAQAEQDFSGAASNSAALAQLLNKNYQGAINTLKSIKNGDGMTEYLLALALTRTNSLADAKEHLQKAVALDPSLADYAAKDIELLKLK